MYHHLLQTLFLFLLLLFGIILLSGVCMVPNDAFFSPRRLVVGQKVVVQCMGNISLASASAALWY